jgi:glycosyltransferase involved in cell wall biosynthesis/2-polyprenyl-3-methyl-5-hydroxy-6-metoxy-1,4-benzoquinol methylase
MALDLGRRLSTFDVVHIHGLYRFHGLTAALIARAHDIPYVIQAHGSLDAWHRAQKRRAKDIYHAAVEDRIIEGASAMICTSRRERASIRRLGYSVPLEVIPIGVDAAGLRSGNEVIASDAMQVEEPVIAFLGRISEKKGVPLVVEAFRRIAAEFPSARLVVAGPDDEGIGRRLEREIREADPGVSVSFPGLLNGSDKRSLLQRADVLVLPSADESFGLSVAEAMAVGRPVVVSPAVGIEQVVRAAGAGLVVDRDPSSIAEAVGRILREPATAAAMGAAGKRVVDDEFSWPAIAERTEALYASVLRKRRSERRRSEIVAARLTSSRSALARGRCPNCRSEFERNAVDRPPACQGCGWSGAAVDGIPILLRSPGMAEHDDLHHHATHHKAAQSAHFDRPESEQFEIDRPHGTPRLYRFLLAEKLRRAIAPIRPFLHETSALVVCGGSGMDAEYFARLGADVTTSDLSLGASMRARARAQRHGFRLSSVVADVEELPFADRSFDTVAVHDGLHHLTDPFAGLSEMVRVARRWVLVSEPANASVTKIATRFGLAVATEAAGNAVARLDVGDVTDFLTARGFIVLKAQRYAMYYPHYPGALFGFLSRPALFPLLRLIWRIADPIVGPFGNKVVVVAEREST